MIHTGSSRIAVELGSLIIKLPRLDLDALIYQVQCAYFMRYNKKNISFFFEVILKSLLKRFLTGMRDNKNEYQYCHETSTDYVAPCVFCLFGIISICKYAGPIGVSIDEFRALKQRLFPGDNSHTLNPDNFGIYNNKIVCRDYAYLPHDTITHYVTKLREALI